MQSGKPDDCLLFSPVTPPAASRFDDSPTYSSAPTPPDTCPVCVEVRNGPFVRPTASRDSPLILLPWRTMRLVLEHKTQVLSHRSSIPDLEGSRPTNHSATVLHLQTTLSSHVMWREDLLDETPPSLPLCFRLLGLYAKTGTQAFFGGLSHQGHLSQSPHINTLILRVAPCFPKITW